MFVSAAESVVWDRVSLVSAGVFVGVMQSTIVGGSGVIGVFVA